MNRSTLYYNIPDGTNRGRGMHHAISPPTHHTETSRTPHGIPRHSAWLLLLLLLRARPSAGPLRLQAAQIQEELFGLIRPFPTTPPRDPNHARTLSHSLIQQ